MFAGARDLEEASPSEVAARFREITVEPIDLGPIDGAASELAIELPAWTPDESASTEEWKRFAKTQQELLTDLDREFRRADATRTAMLIEAYEASMRDLANRFGELQGRRDSPGAQTFLQSTGLKLGMSPKRLAHLLDAAQLLRDRLPLTWETYLAGESTWRAVETAVAQVEGLDDEYWADYDAQASIAVVEQFASRLKAKLHTIRERLQDDTAPERAKKQRDLRRVVIDPGHDGEASIIASGPAIPIIGFDQALTKAAIAQRTTPGETRSVGQLRFDILIDLLVEGIKQSAVSVWSGLKVPERKGVVPAPVLTIPALSALGRSTEQARLLGFGPIDIETAKDIAGTAKSFIRVLTDPITGVRLDMDRRLRIPPADMRRWVVLRDERCRFPGCNRPAHLCDVDHAIEWQHAGVTQVDNLVALSRPHHLAKSLELWNEELTANGSVEWENPWGDVFTDPAPEPSDPAPEAFLSAPDEPCPF
jgi:hypothetical protein